MIQIDASELRQLTADLGKVTTETLPELRDAVDQSGERVEQAWQDNARRTAGKHGKHYPNAITRSTSYGIGEVSCEIGPESSRKQGGMSFEHGSVNQPPHLDGQQATDAEEPRFERAVEDAMIRALGL